MKRQIPMIQQLRTQPHHLENIHLREGCYTYTMILTMVELDDGGLPMAEGSPRRSSQGVCQKMML